MIHTRDIKFVPESNEIELPSTPYSPEITADEVNLPDDNENDWSDTSDDDATVVSFSGSSSSNTEPRRSSRKNKGVPPERYGINAIYELNSIYIPKNVEEVMRDKNRVKWLEAMREELNSMEKNETWDICELPSNRKAVGCK